MPKVSALASRYHLLYPNGSRKIVCLKNFPVQTPGIGSPTGASGSGISTPRYANTPSSTGQLAFGFRAPPAFYSQANFLHSGIVPVSGGSQLFFSCEWFNMIVHRPSIRICTGSGGGCSMFRC
ncbi:Uncharacterized protein Fot_03747 [Forsythia ovata]|uniref:Uncharacterized protein n=1 Tax=Forsythia ovata TaxID=205694 RepID=A0ABD1XDN3_9LAMI